MELKTGWETITYQDQPMRGYSARPGAKADRSLPHVLVIQEIWGVDAHIQDMAERFATAGYHALAPDLYSLGHTPPELAAERIAEVKQFLDRVPPQGWANPEAREQYLAREPEPTQTHIRQTLGRLFTPRDNHAYARQLKAWVEHLAVDGQPVVSVGYCMGGQLSFLLATLAPSALKAAVCNYGMAPTRDEMAHIQCPVFGFYGGTDHRITDAVPDVAQTMAQLGKSFQYRIYPDAGHAFFNDTRISYDPDAARDGWARTLHFFAEQLG
jgi:carboxymethylenebutenolidase